MKLRFYIFLIIPILLIVSLYIGSNYYFLYPNIGENIIVNKKHMLKELTSVAISIIDNSNRLDLSSDEAKALVIERMKNTMYGDDKKSYFWIMDRNAKMIMHPFRKDLNGKDVSTIVDTNGVSIFKDALDSIDERGEGFIEYVWQLQDDSLAMCRKISYVKLYKEWDWIIGTGVYLNKIEEDVKQIRKGGTKIILYISALVLLLTISIIYYGLISEKQRKIVQTQLENSEATFRNLFHNSNDILLVRNFNGVIMEINKKALDVYNIAPDEVIGKSAFDFAPKKYHEKMKKRTLHIHDNESNTMEFELVFKNHEPLVVESKNSLISYNNEPAILATLRDITVKKNTDKQLLNAMVSGEEKERSRMAKELHDGLGPYLSTVKLYFQWLAESPNEEKKKIIIEKGNKSIKEAIDILREISNNFNPHILTNYGLNDAIKSFINKFDEAHYLTIEYKPFDGNRFSQIIEFTLYRIVIELINNTIKHAKAQHIAIAIELIEENLTLFSYSDDGIGFNIDELRKNTNGVGLINMENRINTLNGEFVIYSAPGEGVQVEITLHTI